MELKAVSMIEAKKELMELKSKFLTSLDNKRIENLLDAIDAYELIVSDIETLVCKEVAENIIDELKELHLLFREFDILEEIISTTARMVDQKMGNLRNCNNEIEERIRILEQHPPGCTKCSHNLIIREGKGSYFWGCPDFPDCWGKKFLTKEEEVWIYKGIKSKTNPEEIEDNTVNDCISYRDIIMQLSQGINPITGEVLDDDNFINNPKVIRALYAAVDAMDNNTGRGNEIDDEDLSLSSLEQELFEALREWRIEISKEKNLSAFIIVENKPLIRVSKTRPTSIEELKNIKGFGDYRVTEYGNDIIDIVKIFTEK